MLIAATAVLLLASAGCRSRDNAGSAPAESPSGSAQVGARSVPPPPPSCFDRDELVVSISTGWSGASASDVEDLITATIERVLMPLDGVRRVQSVSMVGLSTVDLTFDAGVDGLAANRAVADALDDARELLPEDAETPLLLVYSRDAQEALTVVLSGASPTQLTVHARELELRARRVPHVADVYIAGETVERASVTLDPERLAAFGLTGSDVARAIQAQSVGLPGGGVEVDGAEQLIRSGDAADLGAVVLHVGSSSAPLRLADIATIEIGPEAETPPPRFDGMPVVTLTVLARRDADLGAVRNALQGELEEALMQAPPDLRWRMVAPERQIAIEVETPSGTDVADQEEIRRRVEEIAGRLPGVRHVRSEPALERVPIRVRLILEASADDVDLARQLRHELTMPGAALRVLTEETATALIEIVAADGAGLGQAANLAASQLASLGDVAGITIEGAEERSELFLTPRDEAMLEAGVAQFDPMGELRLVSNEGMEVGVLRQNRGGVESELPIVVRVGPPIPEAALPESHLLVRTTDGVAILPLAALFHIARRQESVELRRIDAQPAVLVEVLAEGQPAGLCHQIEEWLSGIDWPAGVEVRLRW